MRTTLILFFLCSTYLLSAQLPKGYNEKYYKEMRYGLFVPPTYHSDKSYPLVLYLHGSTDTTSWNHSWYNDPVQSDDPCFVITPKTLEKKGGWGYTGKKDHSKHMRLALEVLDSVITNYNIDTTRLYICGTSMGGYGTFSVLAKEEGRFAAAYIICGGGSPEVASKYLNTPMWIFHGEIDDIVPIKLSRDVYNKMIELGAKKVRYTVYLGVKHNSWENVAKETDLNKWFFAQKKGVEHNPPEKIIDLKVMNLKNNNKEISWKSGNNSVDIDKEVWFYRVYRNKILLAEVNKNKTSYLVKNVKDIENDGYAVTAVNYFFKESEPVSVIYGD